MALYPYQEAGVEFLARKGRAMLADEMGLGKSAQAIVAASRLGARTVRVVCPASLVHNWRREFIRFWPKEAPAPSIDVRSYNRAERGLDGLADVLILDEAHYLKNRTAKRTKTIYGPKCDGAGGLIERAKHVFLLTGTPSPNNPSEMWTHVRAIMPEAIAGAGGKPMSYWSFVQRFCVTRDNGFGIEIKGGKNLAELKARLAPYVLRRRKEEVLPDLPPIRFDTMPLDVSTKALREIEGAAEGAALARIAAVLDKEGVEGLQALAGHVATWRRMVGELKVPPLAERILEELEGGLEKLVVFAHHRSVIEGLKERLGAAKGARVYTLTGSTSPGDRQAIVDAFQKPGERVVLVGQLQAAGTGLTLTAASDLIFAEISWVPAENQQAAMRIHRIGQRNACTVRLAVLPGSIDERIMKAVERKMRGVKELWT